MSGVPAGGAWISRRYVWPLAVLSLVSALGVGLHSFATIEVEDCPGARALFNRGDPVVGSSSALHRFETPQVSQSRLRAPGGEIDFDYTVVRGFEPSEVYYRPERKVLRKLDPERRAVEWVEAEGERVPVHRAIYPPNVSQRSVRLIAGYLLIYEGELVANPYLAQVLRAPRQLVRGRAPMTLLFAHALVPAPQFEQAEAELRALLLDALQGFRKACGTGP